MSLETGVTHMYSADVTDQSLMIKNYWFAYSAAVHTSISNWICTGPYRAFPLPLPPPPPRCPPPHLHSDTRAASLSRDLTYYSLALRKIKKWLVPAGGGIILFPFPVRSLPAHPLSIAPTVDVDVPLLQETQNTKTLSSWWAIHVCFLCVFFWSSQNGIKRIIQAMCF